MPVLNPDSAQPLRDEILAEARREAEQILLQAREQTASILAAARAEADTVRRQRAVEAQAEAERRTQLILATVPLEAGRLRTTRTEEILQSLHNEIRRRLLAQDRSEYRETIVALGAETVTHIFGNSQAPSPALPSGAEASVRISPADQASFGDGIVNEIARRAGVPPSSVRLSIDPMITEGGVIVQSADGRQICDNRLSKRLERLWPELRRQIAVGTGLVGASAETAPGVPEPKASTPAPGRGVTPVSDRPAVCSDI